MRWARAALALGFCPVGGAMSLHFQEPAKRSLAVINPSYIGHIKHWTRFMETVMQSELNSSSTSCDFDEVNYHTIVYNNEERELFKTRLDNVANTYGAQLVARKMVHIHTLHEVLADSNHSVAETAEGTAEHYDKISAGTRKNWIQSAKKMLGCLAYGTDVCFAVDSEAYVQRNTVCHAVSAYMKHKTVLTVPNPYPHDLHTDHSRVIDISRAMLGGADGRTPPSGKQFGEFYAMSLYHWIWEVNEVREFLDALPGPLERMSKKRFKDTRPYVEETFYHWMYPRAKAHGYNYVDIFEALPKIVGEEEWSKIALHNDTTFEMYFNFLENGSAETGRRIAKFFQDNGLLLARCPPPYGTHAESFSYVKEAVDLCISSFQDGGVLRIFSQTEA